MIKKLMLIIILFFITIQVVSAISLSDFDKELFISVFKNVNSDEIDYMARLGLDNEEIGLVLYYYSNADKVLDRNEIKKIVENKESINDFHLYLGMPAIIFEDDLVKLRHPYRERHFPPINEKKYDKTSSHNNKFERVKIRGNNYEYEYQDKKLGIEEKINIKNKKYEYKYKDKNMTEKLEVNYANYKYEYYYKNLNTGRIIKKEGRGEPLNENNVYQEIKKYHEVEEDLSGFSFDITIDLGS